MIKMPVKTEAQETPEFGLKYTVLLMFMLLTFGGEWLRLWKGKENIPFWYTIIKLGELLLSFVSWNSHSIWVKQRSPWKYCWGERVFLPLNFDICAPRRTLLVVLWSMSCAWLLWPFPLLLWGQMTFFWSPAKCKLARRSLPIYGMFSCDWWGRLLTGSRILPGLPKRMSKW